MNFIRSMFVVLVLSVSSGSVATAQDFDKGLAAAHAGDFVTAVAEWRPLAEQGDARAQFNLGAMYSNGDGVPQNYAEAVRWYLLAAEQGYADAQFNLGASYDFGNGVPQDDSEAVRWYRLAAEQGTVLAQRNLGAMYNNGEGVLQDYAEGMKWSLLGHPCAANGRPPTNLVNHINRALHGSQAVSHRMS
jgi:TPR repeat protein